MLRENEIALGKLSSGTAHLRGNAGHLPKICERPDPDQGHLSTALLLLQFRISCLTR